MSADKAYSLPEYRDPFLTCRTFGHAWKLTRTGVDLEGSSMVLLTLTCRSCGTKRTDIVGRHTGRLASRRYDYPEGYRHKTKTARTEYRIEFLSRTLEG